MSYALELKIESSDKTVGLSLKSASQQDRLQVVNLLAALFGAEIKEVNVTVTKAPAKEEKLKIVAPVSKPEPVKKVADVNQPVTKKLSLLDSSRSEIVSLGEKIQAAIQQKESEPEFYKTGIKIDEDGTRRYKCRYYCSCGAKGNHYIPLKVDEVNCHECDQPLTVSLAAGEVDATGIPVKDTFGNYYTAK